MQSTESQSKFGEGEFRYFLLKGSAHMYVFSGLSTAGAHCLSVLTVEHSQKPQIIIGVMCALAQCGDLLNLSVKYSWMSAVNGAARLSRTIRHHIPNQTDYSLISFAAC